MSTFSLRRPHALFHGLMLAVAVVLVWSAINPYDRFTWFLEVVPVLLAVPVLYATYGRLRLTDLTYVLLALHAVILMVGGHYTYAEVPLGFWVRDALDLSRNHYDRLGHFAQGFIPAVLVRELLLRRSPLGAGALLFTLVVSVCLAFSALYELIEWAVAEATGEAAESFLGTQGDIWDTQKDMALALVGAVLAQLLLARPLERSIARVSRI